MAVDTSVIGKPTGKWRIRIERGPVVNFAKALHDNDPAYQRADGPVPPTFGFVMAHWGAFADEQPDGAAPEGPSPVMQIIGELRKKGGLVLHGEQEFDYVGDIKVGDVLVGEGRIADIYERDSKGKTMTFVVSENEYKNEATGQTVLRTRMNLIHRSA